MFILHNYHYGISWCKIFQDKLRASHRSLPRETASGITHNVTERPFGLTAIP